MKSRFMSRSVALSMILSIALLLLLVPDAPAKGSSSAPGGAGTWALLSPPQFCTLGANRCFQVSYRNNANVTVLGIIWMVVHNKLGQTVMYSTSTLNLTAGAQGTTYTVIFGIGGGSYNASIFCVARNGVAISNATAAQFTLP